MFTSDPLTLTLMFYDVTLVRECGDGYVGYKVLFAVSDTLSKFMIDNEDTVLCFYCDSATELPRNHTGMPPQEYRSILFSKMFELYTTSNNVKGFINHRVKIEDSENPSKSQFAHFICRKEHHNAVLDIGNLLMEK